MNIRRTYDRLAYRYDTRWAHYVEATARETLKRLPSTFERALDVGCGTGTLLALMRTRHPNAELFGVDLSPEMLKVAEGKVAADLRVADAGKLPFDDDAFDLVVCSSVFHFLREPGSALSEFRRVLRDRGTLVVTDWCHDYWTCRVCDWLLRRFDRSHFRIYSSQECRTSIEARFRDVSIERYKIDWLWGLMTARSSGEL